MEERILTNEEVNEVLNEANDPKYKIPNFLHLGQKITSVLRVSLNKNLILIRGNDHTGFDHILSRHDHSSKAIFWKQNEKKIYLEKPSRFSLSTIPIYDFLRIAESIYDSSNLNISENYRQESFELYVGNHTDGKNRTVEYKLLLYKGTRIIHTLFPTERVFNKKTKINLHQHFSWFLSDEKKCVDTFYIPYYDYKNIEVAKIVLRLFKVTGIEKWYIQVNTTEGNDFLTYFVEERRVRSYLVPHYRSLNLDHQEDLSAIEGILDKILVGKIKLG